VEGGYRPGEVQSFRGLIAAHFLGLGDRVPIQRSAHWVLERGHRRDIGFETGIVSHR
jgi:hypothetical protein